MGRQQYETVSYKTRNGPGTAQIYAGSVAAMLSQLGAMGIVGITEIEYMARKPSADGGPPKLLRVTSTIDQR